MSPAKKNRNNKLKEYFSFCNRQFYFEFLNQVKEKKITIHIWKNEYSELKTIITFKG